MNVAFYTGFILWGGTSNCNQNGIKNIDYLIRYEDFVRHTQYVLESLRELDISRTSKTIALCNELKTCYIVGNRREVRLSHYYTNKFNELKEMYGYE